MRGHLVRKQLSQVVQTAQQEFTEFYQEIEGPSCKSTLSWKGQNTRGIWTFPLVLESLDLVEENTRDSTSTVYAGSNTEETSKETVTKDTRNPVTYTKEQTTQTARDAMNGKQAFTSTLEDDLKESVTTKTRQDLVEKRQRLLLDIQWLEGVIRDRQKVLLS